MQKIRSTSRFSRYRRLIHWAYEICRERQRQHIVKAKTSSSTGIIDADADAGKGGHPMKIRVRHEISQPSRTSSSISAVQQDKFIMASRVCPVAVPRRWAASLPRLGLYRLIALPRSVKAFRCQSLASVSWGSAQRRRQSVVRPGGKSQGKTLGITILTKQVGSRTAGQQREPFRTSGLRRTHRCLLCSEELPADP